MIYVVRLVRERCCYFERTRRSRIKRTEADSFSSIVSCNVVDRYYLHLLDLWDERDGGLSREAG